MSEATKYPGVTMMGSDPEKYHVNSDGSVVIPHGRPEEGQKLEDSNYYEMLKSEETQQLLSSLGVPTLRDDVDIPVKKTTPKRKKTAKKSRQAQEPEPEIKKVPVEWDIPGIGNIKSEYTAVGVGGACVALYVSSSDTAFIPKDYRDNPQAVYIMKYRGSSYKVIYSGLNYRYDNSTVYVLIGGYNDRQEE